jgi:hypothetical protein
MKGWGPLIAVLVAFASGFATAARGLAPNHAARIDTLMQVQVRVDTQYRADTIRLWRAKTVYDTARVTDTLMRGDTIYVPRDIADEAVQACVSSVRTCEEGRAVADSLARAAWDSVGRIPPPPDLKRAVGVGALLGALLTLLLAR